MADDVLTPSETSASSSAAPPQGLAASIRARGAAVGRSLQVVALSAAVWLLYVPHSGMLWMLGPKHGMKWVRVAATIHWLLTFVGAQRATRRALKTLQPYFESDLSVSQILRRHLELKHECFARLRVYSYHGLNSPQHDVHWRCHPDCVSAIPKADRERGLIIVGYHFNFFQTFVTGLATVVPDCDPVQLRYRQAQCVESALSPVARLALRKALEADRRSGAQICYVDSKSGMISLFRLLRKGGAATLAADGGVADDFVDVPFLDGTLRAPVGWAKLAAGTKSDVLLLCDKRYDRNTREGYFYDHVQCRENTDEAAYAAVAGAIAVLEQKIREEPWGWHPWQRLRVDVGADGVRRYSLKQYGIKEGQKLEGKAAPKRGASAAPSGPRLGSGVQGRPRVAVIANSYPPYRVHLHQRIRAEVPEVELWSLSTHGNAYNRWPGLKPPAEIHPVDFSRGEPTNEQPQMRYSLREWRKGGRIIRWLKQHKVDAVFVQGCGDMGRMRIIHWCKERGVPCLLTGDFNVRSDNHPPLKQWLKRRVYNRGVGWSSGLMPCGAHGLALLHRYGGRGKPALMFPFAPDVQLFENTPPAAVQTARQRFGLQPGRRRIVFSARMMEAKRPDLAIVAFAALAEERPGWDLVMIGDGALRAAVQASVPERLRTRVTWTGFLDNSEDIAGIYAQCDVMLLPSDHEPWGVVIVEAAAAGLAIVASDVVGAAPELVKDGGNGAVFPKGDLAALVAALRKVTAPQRIDEAKLQSLAVLHKWLADCDPVAAFRGALRQCGVLPPSPIAPAILAERYSIRTAGEAVVPV